jgi:hypothetical protein
VKFERSSENMPDNKPIEVVMIRIIITFLFCFFIEIRRGICLAVSCVIRYFWKEAKHFLEQNVRKESSFERQESLASRSTWRTQLSSYFQLLFLVSKRVDLFNLFLSKVKKDDYDGFCSIKYFSFWVSKSFQRSTFTSNPSFILGSGFQRRERKLLYFCTPFHNFHLFLIIMKRGTVCVILKTWLLVVLVYILDLLTLHEFEEKRDSLSSVYGPIGANAYT